MHEGKGLRMPASTASGDPVVTCRARSRRWFHDVASRKRLCVDGSLADSVRRAGARAQRTVRSPAAPRQILLPLLCAQGAILCLFILQSLAPRPAVLIHVDSPRCTDLISTGAAVAPTRSMPQRAVTKSQSTLARPSRSAPPTFTPSSRLRLQAVAVAVAMAWRGRRGSSLDSWAWRPRRCSCSASASHS